MTGWGRGRGLRPQALKGLGDYQVPHTDGGTLSDSTTPHVAVLCNMTLMRFLLELASDTPPAPNGQGGGGLDEGGGGPGHTLWETQATSKAKQQVLRASNSSSGLYHEVQSNRETSWSHGQCSVKQDNSVDGVSNHFRISVRLSFLPLAGAGCWTPD